MCVHFNFKSCAATLQYGGTALHRAAEFGRTAVVEVLVAAGADMATKDTVSLIASVGHAVTMEPL